MNPIRCNLTEIMNKTGSSVRDIANLLDISEDVALSKIEGSTDWSLGEIVNVCALLNCDYDSLVYNK